MRVTGKKKEYIKKGKWQKDEKEMTQESPGIWKPKVMKLLRAIRGCCNVNDEVNNKVCRSRASFDRTSSVYPPVFYPFER